MSILIPNPTLLSPRSAVTIPGGVALADGANLDAFGRLRVSDATTIFNSSFEYTKHPLLWEDVLAGTGASTHAAPSITLATGGTGSGARAMRRTKVYHRYQPGKSQLVKLTGIPLASGTHAGTSTTRMGYYDDNDGFFFCTKSGQNCFVRRSSVSGSVVDTDVASTDWNIDKFDGGGPSGITLDITKEQIVVIDLQWLGVGRVRVGFQINGRLWYAHEFLHANQTTAPYIRAANLPVTYEVINSGGTGANVSMTQVCTAVESEGGVDEDFGYSFRAGMGAATVSCAAGAGVNPTMIPLMTLRLVDLFGGKTYRGHVHPTSFEFINTANFGALVRYIWNATTLTGATFAHSVDATYSGVEFDTAATVVSGGTILGSTYIGSASGASRVAASQSLRTNQILARAYAAGLPSAGGGTRDTLTVAACGIGGAAVLAASCNFLEQY